MISLSPWLLVAIVLAVIALGVVAGFAITRARRLDRLHQRILASRDSLSRLLLRRASEADLLSRSAGLEGSGLADAARTYIQDGGDQLTTDGLDRRTVAQRQGDRVEVAARLERASALSRAIRETLTPEERYPAHAQRAQRGCCGSTRPAFRTNGKIAATGRACSDSRAH